MTHPDTRSISFTHPPLASMWVDILHNLFLRSHPPLPCRPSFLLAQVIFKPNLFPYKYSNIFKTSRPSYLFAYEDGTNSVPKRRHIKFRRRGITQQKAYSMTTVVKFFSYYILKVWDSHKTQLYCGQIGLRFIEFLVSQHVSNPSFGSSSGLQDVHTYSSPLLFL